jgi:hypothetical protein
MAHHGTAPIGAPAGDGVRDLTGDVEGRTGLALPAHVRRRTRIDSCGSFSSITRTTRRTSAYDAVVNDSDSLVRLLARRSADEMVASLGLTTAPSVLRAAVREAFVLASVPLGRVLARFDGRIDRVGIV